MDILLEMIVRGILSLFGLGQEKKPPSRTERPDLYPTSNTPGGPPPIPQVDSMQDALRKARQLQAARQQQQKQGGIGRGTQQQQKQRWAQQLARRPAVQAPRPAARPAVAPASIAPPMPAVTPQAAAVAVDVISKRDAYKVGVAGAHALPVNSKDLSALFRSQPDSVRSAFVLAEILSRPVGLKESHGVWE
jgi:hypothetical protein